MHTSSQESPLRSSPVVATSDPHDSAESLVAGKQYVTLPQASDSQSTGSVREGFTQFSHPPHETALRWTSAIKPERKSNGAETSTDADCPPVSGVGSNSTLSTVSKLRELAPSTQQIPTILLGNENVNSASSQEETSSEHRKSEVVAGMHVRTYSDLGVYERSDEMQSDTWVRALSDSNLVEHINKFSGLLPSDGITETGSTLARRSSKPAPTLMNSSPCEPTQPIPRECNETVMEGVRPTVGVQGEKQPKPMKFKATEVAIQEEQEEDEKMDSNGVNSKVTFVLGEESGGSCIDDEGHSPHSEKESYEDYSSQTAGRDDNVEVMQQMHVLEHACNGRCFQGVSESKHTTGLSHCFLQ